MPRKIESLFIDGPAGRLEALLEEPENGVPREACLVCHPHPLFGGTMHNKVVYRIARAMRRADAVVLRFNFRGVGASEGVHDNGPGEVEDARAALGVLRARYPELPFSMAGFSFGSRIVMKLGCGLALPPARLIAAGFPTSRGRFEYLAHCGVSKFFVQSTIDEHGPRRELEAAFEWFAEPKRLEFIETGDHFFTGALDKLEDAVFEFAKST
ncbi:MAG TPA: alpha/beta family hydrolase [Bryobacteraceae bacterium]|nr:alpha/beta family hydrolase [Bryobacteraceae bacterium]